MNEKTRRIYNGKIDFLKELDYFYEMSWQIFQLWEIYLRFGDLEKFSASFSRFAKDNFDHNLDFLDDHLNFYGKFKVFFSKFEKDKNLVIFIDNLYKSIFSKIYEEKILIISPTVKVDVEKFVELTFFFKDEQCYLGFFSKIFAEIFKTNEKNNFKMLQVFNKISKIYVKIYDSLLRNPNKNKELVMKICTYFKILAQKYKGLLEKGIEIFLKKENEFAKLIKIEKNLSFSFSEERHFHNFLIDSYKKQSYETKFRVFAFYYCEILEHLNRFQKNEICVLEEEFQNDWINFLNNEIIHEKQFFQKESAKFILIHLLLENLMEKVELNENEKISLAKLILIRLCRKCSLDSFYYDFFSKELDLVMNLISDNEYKFDENIDFFNNYCHSVRLSKCMETKSLF